MHSVCALKNPSYLGAVDNGRDVENLQKVNQKFKSVIDDYYLYKQVTINHVEQSTTWRWESFKSIQAN